MKNSTPIYFLLLTLALGLSSCGIGSVAYVSTENQVIPAELQIPSHIKTIRIMDRSINPNLLHRIINEADKGYIGPDRYRGDRIELMRSINKALPQAAQVNFPKEKAGKTDDPADPMPKAKINEHGKGVDGLLCLEQFQYYETRDYKEFQKHQLDQNGKDYYVDAIKGFRTNRIRSFWRLYDVKTGKVLLTIPKIQDYILEVEALNKPSVDTKMDTLNVVTSRSLSLELGRTLGVDFTPKTTYDNWLYHKKGNEKIKLSADLIKRKKFKQASEILEESIPNMTESKSIEIANYNLALAYYLSGEKGKAIETARKARQFTKNKSELDRLLKKMNAIHTPK